MTIEILQSHWALIVASVVGLAVLLFVVWRIWQDSSSGRLGTELRQLQAVRSDVHKQTRALEKAEKRLGRLQARSESVKPRTAQEAAEAVEDGKALLKILQDKVMVVETRVRTIIVEEFPPKRHEALRRRYLGQ